MGCPVLSVAGLSKACKPSVFGTDHAALTAQVPAMRSAMRYLAAALARHAEELASQRLPDSDAEFGRLSTADRQQLQEVPMPPFWRGDAAQGDPNSGGSITGKQKPLQVLLLQGLPCGAPGRTRTCNLQIRSLEVYIYHPMRYN